MTAPLPASYLQAHRYDGAAIQHDRRDQTIPCTIQARDQRLIADVQRHKFLTAPQLLELWWPAGRAQRVGQKRLTKLFQAALLERFRPVARRGSFPWTYHLGLQGHHLLQDAGLLEPKARYRHRAIYDFSVVLHELQLNSWALAARRLLGPRLLRWDGETDIDPPAHARHNQGRLGDYWTVKGLRLPQPRLLRPDSRLEFTSDQPDETTTLLVEFDRTRRLDKNYEKFHRYDAFLCDWWRHTAFGDRPKPPHVLFICQDEQQRAQFIHGADHQLTGHHSRPNINPAQCHHHGRRHVLFAIEPDAHHGRLDAWRLPVFPPGHPARDNNVQPVTLAGLKPPEDAATQLQLPGAA